MAHGKNILHEVWSDEQGASMADYALVLTILAISLLAAISTMTNAINTFFHTTASTLSTF